MPENSEGDFQLKLYPETADNTEDIVWSSEDPAVVSVDSDGKLHSHIRGTSVIAVQTPEAVAQAKVCVQPKIQDIQLPDTSLHINVGERRQWKCRVIPEDAYGADMVKAIISDPKVAVYSGGYVVAQQKGRCRLDFVVNGNTKSTEIVVL